VKTSDVLHCVVFLVVDIIIIIIIIVIVIPLFFSHGSFGIHPTLLKVEK